MSRQQHIEQIRRDPDDDASYLVLADHLQEQGDPWGKLIVLQHELEARRGGEVVAQSVHTLLRKHDEEWCGGLYAHRCVSLEWHCGFIRSARILAGWEPMIEEVDALLSCPTTACLQELFYFQQGVFRTEHLERWREMRPLTTVRHLRNSPIYPNTDPKSVMWLDFVVLDELPEPVGTYENLEWLAVQEWAQGDDPDFSALTKLRRLDINFCYNVERLPESLFGLPHLDQISMYGSNLGGEYNMGTINALLRGFKRARTPKVRRIIESRLLFGELELASELADDAHLLAALDSNVGLVRKRALGLLRSRLANPLAKKPLLKGDVVARLGAVSLDTSVLKESLARCGVRLMTKVNATTTHALIGDRPRGKQHSIGEMPVLVEDHLVPLLETQGDETDYLARLVRGSDREVAAAAVAIQKRGGPAADQWPEVLFAYCRTKGATRKAVANVIEAFAGKELRELVTRHFRASFLGCGEARLSERLVALRAAAPAGFDVDRFAQVMLENANRAGNYFLRRGDSAQRRRTLETLTSNRALDISGFDLRTLPAELGDMPLVELNASSNNLYAIPEPVLRLGNLESLDLSLNRIEDLPPEFPQRLASLRHLNLAQNAMRVPPKAIGGLTQLESLDLSAEMYMEKLHILPSWFGGLTKLRTLVVQRQALRRMAPELFELPALEVLDLHSSTMPPLPDEIGYLPLTRLVITGTNWTIRRHRMRLEELLPQCEIVV